MVTYTELRQHADAGLAVTCIPTPAGVDFYAYQLAPRTLRKVQGNRGYALGLLIGLTVGRHKALDAQ